MKCVVFIHFTILQLMSYLVIALSRRCFQLHNFKENGSISDETCNLRCFFLRHLKFSRLLPTLNTRVKVLGQTYSFVIQTYLYLTFFSICFLGSELRYYQEKAQCHDTMVLWYFNLKGERYLILVECWLYLVTKTPFSFSEMFSPNKMEYGVYCNNII